jgi:hypothetical protein
MGWEGGDERGGEGRGGEGRGWDRVGGGVGTHLCCEHLVQDVAKADDLLWRGRVGARASEAQRGRFHAKQRRFVLGELAGEIAVIVSHE